MEIDPNAARRRTSTRDREHLERKRGECIRGKLGPDARLSGFSSPQGTGMSKDEFVFHTYQNRYDSTDDRTLVNGRLSLNDIALGNDKGSLRLSLWDENLTDEEYRVWGIDFGSLGFTGNTIGEPRTYGIDVVYTYK